MPVHNTRTMGGARVMGCGSRPSSRAAGAEHDCYIIPEPGADRPLAPELVLMMHGAGEAVKMQKTVFGNNDPLVFIYLI